jgi:hypothetical protein
MAVSHQLMTWELVDLDAYLGRQWPHPATSSLEIQSTKHANGRPFALMRADAAEPKYFAT